MKTTDLAYLHQLDQPDEEGAYTRSLLDLIEEGTLDLDLAAFLVSHIARGASFITGSGPGGVGKTTTKRALLSFVPPELSFFKGRQRLGTTQTNPTPTTTHLINLSWKLLNITTR